MTYLLALPSGQVMLGINNGAAGGMGNQAYLYTPDGTPQAAWRPTITSAVANGNHYTLTGTQLNGISAGASHGGNTSGSTNYPIVELKNTAGKVFFARTSNWSSTGVATGSTPVTTDFSLPAGLPLATYQLTVIANGIASTSVPFTGGFTGADLAVAVRVPVGGPYSSNEGDTVPISFAVTNIGPSTATKVVLTDTLGSGWQYIGGATGQGTLKQSGGVVTFTIGSIASGQSANVMMNLQALEEGNLTTTAVVSSNVSDPNTSNNTAVSTNTVVEPPIVVSSPITVTGKNQSNVAVATFTHANGVEPASDFIATINWGDGSISTGSISLSGTTYKVKGSHTYAQNVSHTVTTAVVESENTPHLAQQSLIAGTSLVSNASPEAGKRRRRRKPRQRQSRQQ